MSAPRLRLADLFDPAWISGDSAVEITAVCEDSRRIVPGALFVARSGNQTNGAQFLQDAIARGAAAVLIAADAAIPEHVSQELKAIVRVDCPATEGARAAHRVAGDPANALKVIAITGTNGKTTVAWFCRALLAAANQRCGLLGTIESDDGVSQEPAALTTPGACELAESLARMVTNGCDTVVLEASSHALAQGRLYGVSVDRAIFTNLSGDHLDYHGSLAAYTSAKSQLFSQLAADGVAILNADDPAHESMARASRGTRLHVSTMASDDPSVAARCVVVSMDRTGMDVELTGPWGVIRQTVSLIGRHNAENLLLAVACVSSLGVATEVIAQALGSLAAPPGRLEPVTAASDPLTVLVDYAHTDDALVNVLQALRAVQGQSGTLSVLFGCGGDRDRTKRPRMAQAACRFANKVFVSSDNPRTEAPQAIIDEILTGIPEATRACVQSDPDRGRAIASVIHGAEPGEIVVIAGKGHETTQTIGTKRYDFDDRTRARAVLAQRAEMELSEDLG